MAHLRWQPVLGHASRALRQKRKETPAGRPGPNGTGNGASAKSGRSLRPLSVLWPYLARHKGMLAGAVTALLVAAVATLALPMGVRRMVDHGFSGENAHLIDRYFGMMLVIGLLLALASAARYFCVNWLGERLVADLRADVFSHVTRLSPAFFETTHSGEVMSRLTADTTQIKTAANTVASQVLRDLVIGAGAVAMMVVTSASLSALVIMAIPVIVLPLFGYGRIVRSLSRAAQDTLAAASAFASENLASVRVLQAFTSEDSVADRFRRAVEGSFEAARRRILARAGLTAIAIFLVLASIIAVLWFGAQEVLAGTMTPGRLGQFVLYAVLAAGALGGLSEVWGEVQQAAGAAERLSELLHEEPGIVSPAKPKALPDPPRGRVVFDAVSFVYPGRPEIAALDAVSFTVEPGETVAIVGPSGAGKSTIFSLLLRFYDPSSGTVSLDGVAVGEADLKALRGRMALVPQETALFAETIADNIRYGAPAAGDAAVREAARVALADGFISELPQGYDTLLGEKGVTLSGGQRQRIAIARAVLRDAPLLLLDEATSALDAESEKAVQEALDHVMAGRTTIVIAHRLATVQRADRILVLDKGRIVDEGTHVALRRKKGGVYARLAQLQFGVQAAE